ncbi:MAG: FAD-dependent oxidoreductase [Mesorhizobium sp.]|nr:MAG: FAD-dependent oxidoreductase [Mesorhizobium sp.]
MIQRQSKKGIPVSSLGSARVVVIGGGIVGCSILYHLAKLGATDSILVERQELTSGSSWHAAGNLFSLTSPSNVQRIQKYTIELYAQMERESEQPVGYHPTGGLVLASTREELDTLKIACGQARRNGIEAAFVSMNEARQLAPILNTEGLHAVLFEPLKGHVDPASATQAFAAAARKLGAKVLRRTPVIGTQYLPSGEWEVETTAGTIRAEYVVNAAGLWAREVAELAGVSLPLAPVEHHYMVTEAVPEIAGLSRELPTISDSDAAYYSRQEGHGLLLGAYESTCHHWAVDGTPRDFGHELLPNDLSRMSVNLEKAMQRMPCLQTAGIKRIINGPMIFSPDLGPLLGPHPALRNYMCAAGVMTGFNQGGGIGRMIAEWIIEGEPSLDMTCWDVSRFYPWATKQFTLERTGYFYEHRDDRVYPHQEHQVGRPVRKFPTFDFHDRHRAVFGFANGWEYPLWYASQSEERIEHPSYGRANWFGAVGEECRAVRRSVGLFDVSTYAKYEVVGPMAEDWLSRILAGRVPAKAGKTALSPMVSKAGRLVGDFTVSRLGPERFVLIGAGSMEAIHMRRFMDYLPTDGVQLHNRSAAWAGAMIAGPNARALLKRLTSEDVSNDVFPFLSNSSLNIDGVGRVVALRVSFTGELGYELFCPIAEGPTLLERLAEAGSEYGIRLAGSRALMSLRLEKSFPSWGLELSSDYTPFESGLDRFIDLKRGDFIGRDALLTASRSQSSEKLVSIIIDASHLDCFGGEAVFRNGERIGYVSSGGYGHTVSESLALAYLLPDAIEDGADVEVEIIGSRYASRISLRPRFDSHGERMRA